MAVGGGWFGQLGIKQTKPRMCLCLGWTWKKRSQHYLAWSQTIKKLIQRKVKMFKTNAYNHDLCQDLDYIQVIPECLAHFPFMWKMTFYSHLLPSIMKFFAISPFPNIHLFGDLNRKCLAVFPYECVHLYSGVWPMFSGDSYSNEEQEAAGDLWSKIKNICVEK